MTSENSLPKLEDHLFEQANLDSVPEETIMPNVAAPIFVGGISAGLGILETDLFDTLHASFSRGTANSEYQALVIGGFALISVGSHLLYNYAPRTMSLGLKMTSALKRYLPDYVNEKIRKKLEKMGKSGRLSHVLNAVRIVKEKRCHFGLIDVATTFALGLTVFNTTAWQAGVAKGWNMGYLGRPDYEYDVVKGLGKFFFSAPKIVNLTLPSFARWLGDSLGFGLKLFGAPRIVNFTLPSYAHWLGGGLGFGLKGVHLVNRVKPMKPVERLKKAGYRVGDYFSEFSSKSRLNRFVLKSATVLGLFTASTVLTGHASMGVALVSVPVGYAVKNEAEDVVYYAGSRVGYAGSRVGEYGGRTIERVKREMGRLAAMVYRRRPG